MNKTAPSILAFTNRHLATISIAVFPLILFAVPLLTGKALYWGLPTLQFNAWRVAALESLQVGQLPFWNPWNGMGAPLLANYQLAVFYPPSWLLYPFAGLGGAPALAWAHTLLVAMHLIWAGLGMARLLRRIEAAPLAQAVGGLAFSLSGFFVARSGVFPMVWAGAWLPWLVLAACSIAAPGERSPQRVIVHIPLIPCMAMLLLAGHAQLAWYSLIFTGAWVVVGGWSAGRLRGVTLAVISYGIACLIAIVLTSPQLIPTLEFLNQSQRASAVDYAIGMQYSFWPWRFLTFFAPNFFGTPVDGSYWGYASYWEDAVYIGLLPLLLAFSTLGLLRPAKGAVPEGEKPPRVLARFLWVAVFTFMLLALGKNTPVFPFLYRFVPTFDMFQAPARYGFLVVFSLALLAGMGVSRWRKPIGTRLRWLKRGAVGAAAIALGAGAAAVVLREVEVTFIAATALAGANALLVALLTLRIPLADSRERRDRWQAAVVLLVGIDLLLAGWGLAPTAPISLYADSLNHQDLSEALAGQRVYMTQADEYAIKFWRFYRFDDFRALENPANIRGTLLPNANIYDRIATVSNFDPLMTARYAHWMAELEKMSPAQRLPWLRMMGVGASETINVSQIVGVDFAQVDDAHRWYWTSCASFTPDEATSWRDTSHLIGQAVPGQSALPGVVLEGEAQPGVCNLQATAKVEMLIDTAQRVTLRVNTPQAGWLVLADSYYPGWRATVDEQAAPVLLANYLFRAVAVPEGQHVVVFTYSPEGYGMVLAVSLVGWLGIIAWVARRKKPIREK